MNCALAQLGCAGLVAAAMPLMGQDAPTERTPTLAVSDDRAAAEAFIDLPDGGLDLLGRFEGVIEVRADAGVRIDNWAIEDALGDQVLLTILDEQPLALATELGGWYGRYEVMIEPLVDGDIEVGPLTLTYLIDPDPEVDPTQIEPERFRLVSESVTVSVAGPGGTIPERAAPAKDPIQAEHPFEWRIVFIAGASIGVVGPVIAALVLALRTSSRRDREDAPQDCLTELDALERVVRASEGNATQISGASVAGEALAAARSMLDRLFRFDTLSQSGAELLRDDRLRSSLSVDAYEHLTQLVEGAEEARFAGRAMTADEAVELIGCARRVARALRVQIGAGR